MNNHFLKVHKRHLLLEKQGYKSVNLEEASVIEVTDIASGKDFSFYCNLKKSPSMTFNTETIPYMNGVRHVTSSVGWDNLEFTLYRESESEGSMKFLTDWIRGTFDNMLGRMSYAYTYKRDIKIYKYDKLGIVYESWILQGAFLTNISYNSLDFQERDRVYIEFPGEVECVLSFDRAILVS